ncbi:hypothetical protein ABN028_10895 [Actinopolymorpha sp. B17G11]|uniref:hypothetical protein n=1 Tax=Actinopolymorpha sp. B17G11 TaxID=3160861 RepID=UPI0032E3D852
MPEPPLTVSPDLISSYLPAGYELDVPVEVRAPVGTVAGDTEITLRGGARRAG